MILCEKPLAMNGEQGKTMVDAVEKAGVAESRVVQLPPRPGRDARQAARRRRPAREDLPLPRELSPGLDDLAGRAPGRHGDVAAGRKRGRQRRDGRPARPLHRHGPLAQRAHRERQRDDRDVRRGARPRRDRQEAAGRHRRRLHVLLPVRQRLAGQLRVHALRPRAQGACTRSRSTARRRRPGGTCTTCTGSSGSTTTTRAGFAAGGAST